MTVKKLEHMGIRVQLIGQIELSSERGTVHEFVGMGEQRASRRCCMCCGAHHPYSLMSVEGCTTRHRDLIPQRMQRLLHCGLLICFEAEQSSPATPPLPACSPV